MENQFRYLGRAHIVTLGPELCEIYTQFDIIRMKILAGALMNNADG